MERHGDTKHAKMCGESRESEFCGKSGGIQGYRTSEWTTKSQDFQIERKKKLRIYVRSGERWGIIPAFMKRSRDLT
jgi:hypothetical protein